MKIASFLVYCVIVTFTPGPTNIVILSAVHNFGAKKSLAYVWGATVAFGILLAISAILNSILAAVIPKILSVMQIIGSLYMLYLAYQIYNMHAAAAGAKQTASFVSGFLMQFVNPKVILFTMTVLPSFVMPYYSAALPLAMFVFLVTVVGFSAFITWVLFGTILKGFLQRYQKIVNIIMALFLVYSAVMVSGIMARFKG